MFLRPTESMTIFLQQLGRGMRLSEGKPYLTVLDFVGNYRNAHYKLPFLVGLDLSQDQDPVKALTLLKRWQNEGELPAGIPDGVEVHIEPVALDVLRESLHRASPPRQLVLADLAEIASWLGRTPTMTEWQAQGRYTLRTAKIALGVDRWNRVLDVAGLISDEAQALERAVGDFLKEIETARMTKSFKMVVLLAMCGSTGFRTAIHIDDLIRHFREYFTADRHREDVAGTAVEEVLSVPGAVWQRYLLANPINAWVGGNGGGASPYFAWNERLRELRYIGPLPSGDSGLARSFGAAISDRATAMLHTYWRRPGPNQFVYPLVPLGSSSEDEPTMSQQRKVCIMLERDRDGLPTGWHLVAINGKHLYGKSVKIALNVVKDAPTDGRDSPNLLTSELQSLFGGRIPANARVRFVKEPASSVWQIHPA
jgi:hypothetical protein